MDTFLYFFYSAAYLALFVWSIKITPNTQFWSLRSFIYLVFIGLIFDNTVVAVGRFAGEGDLLEILNLLRYWIHAFFTPTLVLFSLGVLRSAGIKGLNNKFAFYGTVLFTSILIVLEVLTEIRGLKLMPEWKYGVLRYVPIEDTSGPPLMILLVTLVLVISGVLLWKFDGWAWMFIGAIIMTLGSAVPVPVNSSAITNGFEVLLTISLVATKAYQERLDRKQL
ncbi:hypothetical protein [Lentibacillus sp.]|uniref:hypothetical protein n=1 Tax=Lentibacillus sp. TaxID=1925746 RepID=UPI002B4B3F0D|nr:hypothetical protein [Lentibacillus sp.]HLS07529.1 hypothetical protein [Lentibacillus sp.]